MYSQKKFITPLITIILMAVAIASYLYWQSQISKYNGIIPTPSPQEIACTQEAMQCSDGSYVVRQGPNCEFAPCPSEKSTSQSTIPAN